MANLGPVITPWNLGLQSRLHRKQCSNKLAVTCHQTQVSSPIWGSSSQLHLVSKFVIAVFLMECDWFDLLLSYRDRHMYLCWTEQRLMTRGLPRPSIYRWEHAGKKKQAQSPRQWRFPPFSHTAISWWLSCAHRIIFPLTPHSPPLTLQGWEADPVSCPGYSSTHRSL